MQRLQVSASLLEDNEYLPHAKGKMKHTSKNIENAKCFMSVPTLCVSSIFVAIMSCTESIALHRT